MDKMARLCGAQNAQEHKDHLEKDTWPKAHEMFSNYKKRRKHREQLYALCGYGVLPPDTWRAPPPPPLALPAPPARNIIVRSRRRKTERQPAPVNEEKDEKKVQEEQTAKKPAQKRKRSGHKLNAPRKASRKRARVEEEKKKEKKMIADDKKAIASIGESMQEAEDEPIRVLLPTQGSAGDQLITKEIVRVLLTMEPGWHARSEFISTSSKKSTQFFADLKRSPWPERAEQKDQKKAREQSVLNTRSKLDFMCKAAAIAKPTKVYADGCVFCHHVPGEWWFSLPE
jgi:hypothetical protein